jgi:hypothetical protein
MASDGWQGFFLGFHSSFASGKSLIKPMPSIPQIRVNAIQTFGMCLYVVIVVFSYEGVSDQLLCRGESFPRYYPGKSTLGCLIQILFFTQPIIHTYIESLDPRGKVTVNCWWLFIIIKIIKVSVWLSSGQQLKIN